MSANSYNWGEEMEEEGEERQGIHLLPILSLL